MIHIMSIDGSYHYNSLFIWSYLVTWFTYIHHMVIHELTLQAHHLRNCSPENLVRCSFSSETRIRITSYYISTYMYTYNYIIRIYTYIYIISLNMYICKYINIDTVYIRCKYDSYKQIYIYIYKLFIYLIYIYIYIQYLMCIS